MWNSLTLLNLVLHSLSSRRVLSACKFRKDGEGPEPSPSTALRAGSASKTASSGGLPNASRWLGRPAESAERGPGPSQPPECGEEIASVCGPGQSLIPHPLNHALTLGFRASKPSPQGEGNMDWTPCVLQPAYGPCNDLAVPTRAPAVQTPALAGLEQSLVRQANKIGMPGSGSVTSIPSRAKVRNFWGYCVWTGIRRFGAIWRISSASSGPLMCPEEW